MVRVSTHWGSQVTRHMNAPRAHVAGGEAMWAPPSRTPLNLTVPHGRILVAAALLAAPAPRHLARQAAPLSWLLPVRAQRAPTRQGPTRCPPGRLDMRFSPAQLCWHGRFSAALIQFVSPERQRTKQIRLHDFIFNRAGRPHRRPGCVTDPSPPRNPIRATSENLSGLCAITPMMSRVLPRLADAIR